MHWAAKLLSRILGPSEWRAIETAPFDRAIELALINDEVRIIDGARLRHGDGWIDTETLRPVAVAATHWRYPRPAVLPMSCCG
jgi:hypothetical protein